MDVRAALLLTLGLSGCGSYDPSKAHVGRFEGSLFVMWIDGGNNSGDGKFVYVPDPRNPLTFYRRDERGNPLQVRGTIQPEMMYTDGGSVPRVAQAFRGFNPWGYAPAYMIHDWLFDAHHCNEAGAATPAERVVAGMTFQESAYILGEAIETLVAEGKVSKADVAELAIPSAVAGPVSRRLWEDGDCPIPRVRPEDAAKANAAFGGAEELRLRRAGARPAQIVATINFGSD